MEENKKKKISIGLDLGVASCGFCCMDITDYDNPICEDIGVRLFESIKTTGNNIQNAKIRRNFRQLRRSFRRKRFKKDQLIKLFIKYNFLQKQNIESKQYKKEIIEIISNKTKPQKKPLDLIIDAIDNKRQLSIDELIIVLYSYFNHRGFFYAKYGEKINNYPSKDFYKFKLDNFGKNKGFNAITDEQDKEDIKKEYFDYSNVNISNDDWIKEINKLIDSQNFFKTINPKFKEEYEKLFRYIREYSKGPGSENSASPFGLYKEEIDSSNGKLEIVKKVNVDNLWELNIKKCKVCEDKPTELLKSPLFQLTNLLGDILNIKFLNKFNELEKVNSSELKQILDKISNFVSNYLEKTNSYNNKYDLKPNDYLRIFQEVRDVKLSFNNLDSISGYKTNDSTKSKSTKNKDDVKFPALNNLIFTCNFLYKHNKLYLDKFKIYDTLLIQQINSLFIKFNVFLQYQQDKAFDEFKKYLISNYFKFDEKEINKDEIIELFQKISNDLNSGRCNFCDEAIIEYLNYIFSFNQKKELLKNINSHYYEKIREKEIKWLREITKNTIYIPKDIFDKEIISPNSRRTLLQSIKVLNTLIKNLRKKYKDNFELSNLIIETAKEENDDNEKAIISKLIKKNTESWTNAKNLSEEIKKEQKNKKAITSNILEKVYLWLSQDKHDIYTQEFIDPNDLIGSKYQIDHIIPISISGIDSLDNKVLTTSSYNQDKTNKIPSNFLLGTEWEKFKENVEKLFRNKLISKQKREYLLIQGNEWKANFLTKSLNDTRTSTKILKKYLVLFKEVNNNIQTNIWDKVQISSINGIYTHLLRESIFSNSKENIKDRSINNHHAIDACLISYFGSNPILLNFEKARDNWKAKYYNNSLKNSKLIQNNDFNWNKVINQIKQNNFFINFIKQINNNEKGEFNNQYIKFSYPLLKKENKQLFDETLVKEYKSKDKNNKKTEEIYIEKSILLTQNISKKDLEKLLTSKKNNSENESSKNKEIEKDITKNKEENNKNYLYLIKPDEIDKIEKKEKESKKSISWFVRNNYPLIMWQNDKISWQYKKLSEIFYNSRYEQDNGDNEYSNPFLNYIKEYYSNNSDLFKIIDEKKIRNLAIPLFKNGNSKPTLIRKLRYLDTLQNYFIDNKNNCFQDQIKTIHTGLNKFFFNVYKTKKGEPFCLNIDKRYIKYIKSDKDKKLQIDEEKIFNILREKDLISNEPVFSIFNGTQFVLNKDFYNDNNIKEKYWWIDFVKYIAKKYDNDYIRFKSIGSIEEPANNPRIELKFLNFFDIKTYYENNKDYLKEKAININDKGRIRPRMPFILQYFDLIKVDSLGNIKSRIKLSKFFQNFHNTNK